MLKSGNTSINATSQIDGVDIAYFSASFSGEQGGSYTISKNITNATLYAENQDECDADYSKFEEKAKELAWEFAGKMLAYKIQEGKNE